MTDQEFENVVDAVLGHCKEVLTRKKAEYARGTDRLHNFKRAAAARNVTPEAALMGMKVKHDISVEDMVNDIAFDQSHPMAQWQEKIGDAINYLILLMALVIERKAGTRPYDGTQFGKYAGFDLNKQDKARILQFTHDNPATIKDEEETPDAPQKL